MFYIPRTLHSYVAYWLDMIRSSVITGNIVDYAATYQVKAGPGHSGTAAALTCNRFRFNAAAEACRAPIVAFCDLLRLMAFCDLLRRQWCATCRVCASTRPRAAVDNWSAAGSCLPSPRRWTAEFCASGSRLSVLSSQLCSTTGLLIAAYRCSLHLHAAYRACAKPQWRGTSRRCRPLGDAAARTSLKSE